MESLRKIAVLLVVFMLIVGIRLPITQARSLDSGDLIKVAVNITIENPEYFWQYPFEGKQTDSIRFSSMGKTVLIQSPSAGQIIEFEVPKGYNFRLGISIPNSNSTNKESYYIKRDISETNNTVKVLLKAPEKQSVIIKASDFDEMRN